jgi:hypothetical protein
MRRWVSAPASVISARYATIISRSSGTDAVPPPVAPVRCAGAPWSSPENVLLMVDPPRASDTRGAGNAMS